ncbi:hypothetical protein DFH05DRAFT_1298427 [Lentinula detonsa]|uniref:Uncharacterized protein n=1 Tax=Lentinula detonsa TaxID=2804962 RepID=A0A9W8NY87_9AGAR|nr:hypothetical protein DFH05DRAFT_1298427 [Lentinula detonsa]
MLELQGEMGSFRGHCSRMSKFLKRNNLLCLPPVATKSMLVTTGRGRLTMERFKSGSKLQRTKRIGSCPTKHSNHRFFQLAHRALGLSFFNLSDCLCRTTSHHVPFMGQMDVHTEFSHTYVLLCRFTLYYASSNMLKLSKASFRPISRERVSSSLVNESLSIGGGDAKNPRDIILTSSPLCAVGINTIRSTHFLILRVSCFDIGGLEF